MAAKRSSKRQKSTKKTGSKQTARTYAVKRNQKKKSVNRKSPARSVKATRSKQKSVKRKNDFLQVRKVPPLQMEKEIAYPVKNRDNNLLVGVLHEPKKACDTIVIAAHGFTSNKERPGIKHACIGLARSGVAAYRFDFSGNGDSEGRFEDATPRKLLNDLDAVIEHFAPKYKRIVLYGRSMGGWLSLLIAPTKKLTGLIVVAAPVHWDQTFEQRFTKEQSEQLSSVGFTTIDHKTPYGDYPLTLREQFVKEVKQLHALENAKHITCPVLIIHGTADTSVAMKDSEDLALALKRKELYIIGGADHRTSNPQHLDDLVKKVVEWVHKL
jgi:uncharacterized protein